MLLAFDLDGVLIDSREANLKAYRIAGFEPPEDFYSRAWETFCSREIHDMKNMHFRDTASFVRRMPLMRLALATDSTVLSFCSAEALTSLTRHLPVLQNLDIRTGLRSEDKIRHLQRMGGIPGVYFDDDAKMCERVSDMTGWQVCHVR